MSTVIVAEKPSVARDIAGVVGAGRKRDGYLESTDGQRIVTWAFGHLVRYADPDDYGAAWSGKWGFGQLPMIPDTWELRVDKDAGKQFGIVKRLINAAERVICATDAGREGEHIFRLIYEHAGCQAPVQRLWVSSLTREALSAGFPEPLCGPRLRSVGAGSSGAGQSRLAGRHEPDTRLHSPEQHAVQRRAGPDADIGNGGGARPPDRDVHEVGVLRSRGPPRAGL